METCYDAVEATTSIAEEHYPFNGSPGTTTCIRLGEVPFWLMTRVCANNGLVITHVEQRSFPDGEDTVLIVKSLSQSSL